MENYYKKEVMKAFRGTGESIKVKFVGNYEVNQSKWLDINKESIPQIIDALKTIEGELTK